MLDQDAPLTGTTVAEALGSGWEAAAILDRLGMGGRLDETVATLSGGEAKRVALARALTEVGPPNEAGDDVLLVLDEPTNHLDIDAIVWLEQRLAAHRGGLLLVTHDRHVLDRVTTRIVELDRGAAYVHEGGYAGYLEARAEREAQAVRQESNRRNLARAELAWLRRGRAGPHLEAEGPDRSGDGHRRGPTAGGRSRRRAGSWRSGPDDSAIT